LHSFTAKHLAVSDNKQPKSTEEQRAEKHMIDTLQWIDSTIKDLTTLLYLIATGGAEEYQEEIMRYFSLKEYDEQINIKDV